jgi:hypothetical protein
MENPTLALCVSFLALCCVVISYFLKSKALYLLFQSVGIVFLVLTYFFSALFFPMISLFIGLFRVLIYFVYEQKQKTAPMWVALLLILATLTAYVVVNVILLKTARLLDILNVAAMVLYALIMRVRNLKFVRFAIIAPAFLSVLYNLLLGGQPFATALYLFEIAACVLAILRFYVLPKSNPKKQENSEKEKKTNEND